MESKIEEIIDLKKCYYELLKFADQARRSSGAWQEHEAEWAYYRNISGAYAHAAEIVRSRIVAKEEKL